MNKIDRARARVRAFGRALNLARARVRALHLSRARALNLARDRVRALKRSLSRARKAVSQEPPPSIISRAVELALADCEENGEECKSLSVGVTILSPGQWPMEQFNVRTRLVGNI